jgi:hypothetical protein
MKTDRENSGCRCLQVLLLTGKPTNFIYSVKSMSFKIRHIHRGTIFFPIMLVLINAIVSVCSSRVSGSPQKSLSPPEIKVWDEPQEEVVINGSTYSILPPWIGKKITAPEFDYSDFRQIPVEYTHNGSKIYILTAALQPMVELLQAAEKDGISLKVESAYRSEEYQKRIFKRMLEKGRTFADIVRYVAPPGYSQHVLGTAVDFFPSNWRFADTPDYAWLREKGRLFGFEETHSQFNPMKIAWEAWHWNLTGKKDGYQTSSDLLPVRTKKS